MTTMAEIRHEIASIKQRMRATVERYGPDQEMWTLPVREEYDARERRLNTLEAELRDRLRDLAANPAAGETYTPAAVRPVATGDHQQRLAEHRDTALRCVEAYDQGGVLSPRAADRLDRLVRFDDPGAIGAQYLAAVGNVHYNSAFGKMVKDPMHGHLRFSPAEVEAVRQVGQVEEFRALAVGSGSAGGFAVPFSLDPSILLTSNGAINPIRQLADVETIVTTIWKGVSSDGVVAAYAAEATEASDNSPTLAQPSIKAEKAFAFVPFSIEVDQDWTAMQAELFRLMADARDVVDATMFLTGTGANQPGGILNIGGTGGLTTTQRLQTNTVAVTAVGDAYALKQLLGNTRFFGASTWLFNSTVGDVFYRFVGGNSTEPPLFDAGRNGTMLGRPFAEWSTMQTGVTTTGNKIAIFGDLTGFKIVDRLGLAVDLIPHLFGPVNRYPTGQRGLYAYWRTGAGVVRANALRYLEVK